MGMGGVVGKSNGNNGSYILGFTYRFRHRMIGATYSRMLCGKSACTKCIQSVYKGQDGNARTKEAIRVHIK